MGRAKRVNLGRSIKKLSVALKAGDLACGCHDAALTKLHRLLSEHLSRRESPIDSEPEIVYETHLQDPPIIKTIEILPRKYKVVIKPPRKPEVITLD
jgi:hypothetical protein